MNFVSKLCMVVFYFQGYSATAEYIDYPFPDNMYFFKDYNRNTRKMCEIRSKLAMKTLK